MSKSGGLYMDEISKRDDLIQEMIGTLKFLLEDGNSKLAYETRLIIEASIAKAEDGI